MVNSGSGCVRQLSTDDLGMALLIADVSEREMGKVNQLFVHCMKLIQYNQPHLQQLQLQLLPGLNWSEWSHHTSLNQSLTRHLLPHYFPQIRNGYENCS